MATIVKKKNSKEVRAAQLIDNLMGYIKAGISEEDLLYFLMIIKYILVN